jgi:hypothetical protein
MLWLLASDDKTLTGELPVLSTISFRLRIGKEELSNIIRTLGDWVEYCDSELLATSAQPATPETETEAEGETEKEKNTKKKKAGYGEDFERFWKAYPRKKAKGQAHRAWTKTKGNRPPLAELLEIVTRQANSPDWLRDGGQYIPYPATWLNGASWDDEDTLDPCAVAMSLLEGEDDEL